MDCSINTALGRIAYAIFHAQDRWQEKLMLDDDFTRSNLYSKLKIAKKSFLKKAFFFHDHWTIKQNRWRVIEFKFLKQNMPSEQ